MRKVFLILCISFILSIGLASALTNYIVTYDNFNDNVFNTTKWSSTNNSVNVLVEQNNRLELNTFADGGTNNPAGAQETIELNSLQSPNTLLNISIVALSCSGSGTGAPNQAYECYTSLSIGSTLITDKHSQFAQSGSIPYSYSATYGDMGVDTIYLSRIKPDTWQLFIGSNNPRNFTGLTGNLSLVSKSRLSRSGSNSATSISSTLFIDDVSLDGQVLTTSANSPGDLAIRSGNVTFNGSIFTSNLNNSNLTLFIWNNAGSLVYNATTNLAGTGLNTTNNTFGGFSIGTYKWNYLGCGANATYSACVFDTNKTLFWGFIENNRSYNLTTTETLTEGFTLNVTIDSSSTLSIATLYYNNTAYPAVITQEINNTYIVTRSISIPSVSATVNMSVFWNLFYSNGANMNTSITNQTVQDIIFVPCNATYTTVALNFSIYEEGTGIPLNASLQTAYNFYFDGGSGSAFSQLIFANNSENQSNYQFCISPASLRLRVSGPTSYVKTGYDRREYWFVNALINNITQNIPLYLLSTAASDVVTLTVLDQNDNPISGAYVFVQRWDIGTDTFSTVGVVPTSSGGTGLINLRLNDAWYRFTVVYNGITYLITSPEKLGTTSKQLTINLIQTSPYNTFNNISHTLTFNNVSNSFTFLFNDPSGAVTQGCLRVSKVQGNGTILLDSSCLTTTAGSLSYTTTENGTFIAVGSLVLNSNYSSVALDVDTLMKTVGTEARFATLRTFGQVISFVMIGTAGFFGVVSGSLPLGLGLILAVCFFVYKLGWLNIVPVVIWSIIAIVIMIAITLRRRFQQ